MLQPPCTHKCRCTLTIYTPDPGGLRARGRPSLDPGGLRGELVPRSVLLSSRAESRSVALLFSVVLGTRVVVMVTGKVAFSVFSGGGGPVVVVVSGPPVVAGPAVVSSGTVLSEAPGPPVAAGPPLVAGPPVAAGPSVL